MSLDNKLAELCDEVAHRITEDLKHDNYEIGNSAGELDCNYDIYSFSIFKDRKLIATYWQQFTHNANVAFPLLEPDIDASQEEKDKLEYLVNKSLRKTFNELLMSEPYSTIVSELLSDENTIADSLKVTVGKRKFGSRESYRKSTKVTSSNTAISTSTERSHKVSTIDCLKSYYEAVTAEGIDYLTGFYSAHGTKIPYFKRKRLIWMLANIFDYNSRLPEKEKTQIIDKMYKFLYKNSQLLDKQIFELEKSTKELRIAVSQLET